VPDPECIQYSWITPHYDWLAAEWVDPYHDQAVQEPVTVLGGFQLQFRGTFMYLTVQILSAWL